MILVTGSDGFVGSYLCCELLRQGRPVLCTKRAGHEKRMGEGKEFRQKEKDRQERLHLRAIDVGNIGPNTDWMSALVGINAVVHLAARVHVMHEKAADPLREFRSVNVEGTRCLAEAAARAGVKRFLFLSSVKVNGETTDTAPHGAGGSRKKFTEDDAPHPGDAYGVSKWEAEQVLREIEQRTGIDVVIIRAPLIYGPGVKGNFLQLIKLIEHGIPLPFGSIRNQRSFLSLTNLVDLICCCLDHSAAAGETFLASDGDDISTPELVRRIARALGKPERLFPVPKGVIRLAGSVTGKSNQVERLCGSLQINLSKVQRVLRWTPPRSMAEELAEVAAWRAGRVTLAMHHGT